MRRNQFFAGVLALLVVLYLAVIWFAFLFLVQPSGTNILQGAWEAFQFAISPGDAESWFFIYTIGSIVLGIFCAALLFFTRHYVLAMVIVAIHAVTGIFVYQWILVVIIALPLILAKNLASDA